MTLEDQYRRLTRLFPAEWRARNEEELIGTLLDAAEPGRVRVSPGEVLDLVRGAAVLRLRAAVSRSAPAGLREPARRAASLALAAMAVVTVAVVAAAAVRFWVGHASPEFLATSFVVAVVPGTGVVYTISCALTGGRRRGSFAAVGCTLGIVPHISAAMLGLSGIMQTGAVAFEVVRWAGVAYLVFMGVAMIRDGGALQLAQDRVDGTDGSDGSGSTEPMSLVVRRGILLNLLNPKLTLFFFAFLPQFLDTPPGLLDPRLVGLGVAFMAVTLVVFVAYAWTSAAVRERVLAAPALRRWIQRSLGALVIGFAARLAVTDR